MRYIVVEKKDGIGWVELLTCSLEADAEKVVAELYREAKMANVRREFKTIELEGNVDIPEDKPRKPMMERIEDKLIKIAKR